MESLTLLGQEDTPLKNSVQSQVNNLNHKVEYTTVSVPSSELGPLHAPLLQASVSPPTEPKVEGTMGNGVKGPNSDDWRKSLVICQLCVLNAGIAPQSQFSHSCVCKRFIYSQNSVHIFGCSKIDRPLLDIYKSLTYIRVQELGDRVL